MLKNLQKYLILKQPLIWNTKFIPMLIIGLLLNVIYFFIGYFDASIDFKYRYASNLEFSFYLFIVLVTAIILIIWLVQYFKNNSFKTLYEKSKYALFFEWLQVFIVLILLFSFSFTIGLGSQLRMRSYFSSEEVKDKCETLAKGDFFINGGFAGADIDSLNSVFNDTVISGEPVYRKIVEKNYVTIFNKKYKPTSLINRIAKDFSIFNREQDSLHTIQVKKLLSTNDSTGVKKIMHDYFKIIDETKVLTNLNEKIWFESIYDFPTFQKYLVIADRAPGDKETYGNYSYESGQDYETPIDSVAIPNFSKYFIERNTLVHNFSRLSDAHSQILFDLELILSIFYFALGFSLLIFSFRVTSGKSWLIAILVLAILNLFFGLIASLSKESLVYFYMLFFAILIFWIIYMFSLRAKRNYRVTKTIINLIIWSIPAIIPLVYFIVMEIYNVYNGSYHGVNNLKQHPFYEYLSSHITEMLILNLIVFIFVVVFYSKSLRNWKSIAEE